MSFFLDVKSTPHNIPFWVIWLNAGDVFSHDFIPLMIKNLRKIRAHLFVQGLKNPRIFLVFLDSRSEIVERALLASENELSKRFVPGWSVQAFHALFVRLNLFPFRP